MAPITKIGYYYITDSKISKLSHVQQVRILVENNLKLKYIQYREKNKSFQEMRKDLTEISWILNSYNQKTKLIVNDYLELALEFADGVHLGRDDINALEAINKVEALGKKLNSDFEIGLSATSLDELEFFQNNFLEKISYIGYGPIFHTTTKKDAANPVGLESLRKAIQVSKIPIVAIGGINQNNLEKVMACNPHGIAAISMVLKETFIDVEVIRDIQQKYGIIN